MEILYSRFQASGPLLTCTPVVSFPLWFSRERSSCFSPSVLLHSVQVCSPLHAHPTSLKTCLTSPGVTSTEWAEMRLFWMLWLCFAQVSSVHRSSLGIFCYCNGDNNSALIIMYAVPISLRSMIIIFLKFELQSNLSWEVTMGMCCICRGSETDRKTSSWNSGLMKPLRKWFHIN
jgi:hypothetical protein